MQRNARVSTARLSPIRSPAADGRIRPAPRTSSRIPKRKGTCDVVKPGDFALDSELRTSETM